MENADEFKDPQKETETAR